MAGAETGFQIANEPDTVRAPDVAFLRAERVGTVPVKGYFQGAPDLAVEVISKGNTPQEMERKLSDYFAAGVRQVWYVYHSPRREVLVYASPTERTVLGDQQTLDGGDLLPGFTLPLKDFFAEPSQTSES